MLSEPGALRRWWLRRAALAYPQLVAVDLHAHIADLQLARSANKIELPLLETAHVYSGDFTDFTSVDPSDDLIALISPVIENTACLIGGAIDFCGDAFRPLKAPDPIYVDLLRLIATPPIIDLFVPFRKPPRRGKAYAEQSTAKRETSASPTDDEVIEQAKKLLRLDRCCHGMVRSQCYTCRHESSLRKRRRKSHHTKIAHTVDLFDLLLPYLQPPLHSLLAQPILFPVGRRPYDYQIAGIRFLAEQKGALLGDEMGLGKTIQAIVALQLIYRRGDAKRTLILCPRSLLGTWEKEIHKWAKELFVQRVRGTKAERRLKWKAPSAIYLTTYETLREDIEEVQTQKQRWDVAILDEVQKIKNPSTKTSRAVRRISASYRWGLSGTPLENRLEDVAAIFDYLKPGLFLNDDALTPEGVRRRIEPHFLRRRTGDVRTELPDKLSNEIWLSLTAKQRQAYIRTETAGKRKLEGENATRVHVFALINELKQICNMDPESGESCKADYLVDQLDGIVESGNKALVFSHLPHVSLSRLEPRLRQFGSAMFDGRLNDTRRDQLISDFQEKVDPHVLLMSVKAGGVGLTLTAANHVFHFDHWWNPAVARQAEGRAHRIGQDKTVFVHDIYTSNTIEERIHHLLQDKQTLFDNVIDELSTEHVEGAISDDELFGLFDLRPPASPPRVQRSSSSKPRATRSNRPPHHMVDSTTMSQ